MPIRILENEKLKKVLLIILIIALTASFISIILYAIIIYTPDASNGDG